MSKRKHLPDDWEQIARRTVVYWHVLSQAEQVSVRIGRLHHCQQAVGGGEVDSRSPTIVVTIAAQVAVLILGLDTDYFGKVTSIIVHPSAFTIPGPRPTAIRGMIDDGAPPLHGEAHHDRGPILLAWDEARVRKARYRGMATTSCSTSSPTRWTCSMESSTARHCCRTRWRSTDGSRCASELNLMRSGQGGPLLGDYAATPLVAAG